MNCMSPVPSGSPDAAGLAVANDYDSFAEAYAAENQSSLINAHYCRPAMLDLAGDVAGRRILDAGCGAGPMFEALSSPHLSCTTCRTGRHHWPSCGECCGPEGG
jgi:ubiquinone/menaquinone biosynthesis C-methylase UbiE